MKLFVALFVCLVASAAALPSDPRACPVIDVDTQLTPVDGLLNTYRITFVNRDATYDPDFVDLHIKVDNKESNIRLASNMNSKSVTQDGVVVQPGETLRYYATYSVNGVSCDTDMQEFVGGGGSNPQTEFIAPPVRTQPFQPIVRPRFTNPFIRPNYPRVPPSNWQPIRSIRDVRRDLIRPFQPRPVLQQQPITADVGAGAGADKVCPAIATETVLTKSTNNMFKLTFINYDAAVQPDWIDLHYQIEGKDQMNLRLSSLVGQKEVSHDGIVLLPSETIHFSATYQVNGVSCDQPVSSYTHTIAAPLRRSSFGVHSNEFNVFAPSMRRGVGASKACPIINANTMLTKDDALENTFTISFINQDGVNMPEWVDIHMQVQGKEQMNVRLVSGMSDSMVSQRGVVVLPGETLRYSATYSIDGVSCETEVQEYTAHPINVLTAASYRPIGANTQPITRTTVRRAIRPTSSQYEVFAAPAMRDSYNYYGSSLPLRRPYLQQQPITKESVSAVCPSIQFDQKVEPLSINSVQPAWQLSFINKNINPLALDFVDLHYAVDNQPVQNIRIGAGHVSVMDQTGLLISAGSTLRYSFTYSVNGVACDTDTYDVQLPQVNAPINLYPAYIESSNAAGVSYGTPLPVTRSGVSESFLQQQPIMQQQPFMPTTLYGQQQPIMGGQQPIVNAFNPSVGLFNNRWSYRPQQQQQRITRLGMIPSTSNIVQSPLNRYVRDYNPARTAFPTRYMPYGGVSPIIQQQQTASLYPYTSPIMGGVGVSAPFRSWYRSHLQQPISSGMQGSTNMMFPNAIQNAVCPAINFDQKVEKLVQSPNVYLFSFLNKQPDNQLDFIDFHYQLENGEELNVQLDAGASVQTDAGAVSSHTVYLLPNQNVKFWFSYSVNGVACETPRIATTAN